MPELRGQEGQGFARPGCVLQGGQGRVAGGTLPHQEHGCFREGPRERGVADLRARGPVALPRRLLRALDEAALGEDSLDARAASDLMDGIEPQHAQARANPGDCPPQVQGLGLRRLWPL